MSTDNLYAETRVVLHGVPWSTFESLVTSTDHRGARFAYDQGYLEIMSPSDEHERCKGMLGRMIELLTLELGIPIRSAGSWTLRSQLRDRGLEPDECYYVANERLVRGKKRVDLAVDPPPDLAIEVDISRSSLDKLAIYASVGVPEVWVYGGSTLEVHQLQPNGAYARQTRSPAFPQLPLDEVERFLARRDETDETTWACSFREFARQLADRP
jgi:Uma2 family endonuclease